jgi:ABC-type transport system involved in multi-copper enzyme maturation permease subunit
VTFLPVVERELRVAARKRSTFWMRVVAAIVAVIIGGLTLLMFRITGSNMFNVGGILFQTLGWLAFGAALLSGLFLTADCLSEEKREGTIGLLFLTDLRGYDVVAGKFISHSLRAFYGLLAIFPVLAMIMLMGGVTGRQFWHTNLALLNALICSLVAGVFISALSRDAQKALAATFFLLVAMVGLGPLLDSVVGTYPLVFSIASPIYIFNITAMSKDEFWIGLLICQGIAAALFVATCVLLPRKWQSGERAGAVGSWSRFWRYGSARRQNVLRQKLMSRSPVLWLVSRERWQAMWLWIGVGVGIVLLACLMWTIRTYHSPMGLLSFWSSLDSLLKLFTYFWVALQATRFFFDSKKTGFIELLLSTPVGVGEIVRGPWLGFVRMFALTVLLVVVVDVVEGPAVQSASVNGAFAATAASTRKTKKITSTQSATTNSAGFLVSQTTNTTGSNTTTNMTVTIGTPPATVSARWPLWVSVLISVGAAISYLTNLAALSWFGGWMGVTSKKPGIAILKTMTFVLLIPWFCISIGAGIISMLVLVPAIIQGARGSSSMTSYMVWFPLASAGVTTVLTIAKDAFFIRWARKKLYGSLRERATQSVDVPMAPPVIATPSLIVRS